jgi:uncharacterized glyoxalase superfamily protein PhnB
MNFEGLIPVIQCKQIEQTLDFYQQALRYIVINKTQDEFGLQWAYIKSDNTYLMLQKNTSLQADQVHHANILLHYYTKDVSAQRQFMAAKGINVGQLEDTAYYIRQFYVDDPEGNRIVIGQDLKKN